MSKCRQELVKKAFVKLDKTGDGVITVEDLKGVYKVDEHPKYKSGEWTKQKCFQQFLDTFQINDDEKVTSFIGFSPHSSVKQFPNWHILILVCLI